MNRICKFSGEDPLFSFEVYVCLVETLRSWVISQSSVRMREALTTTIIPAFPLPATRLSFLNSRRPMPEIATQYEQHNHLTDLADGHAVRRAAADVAAVLRERALLVANSAAAAQVEEGEAHRSFRDDGVVVDDSLSDHINRSRSDGITDDASADANVPLGKVCVVHCAGVHTKDSIGSLASLASLPRNSSRSRNAIDSSDGSASGVEAMQRTFQVNVVSPALLTSSLLPSMGPGSSVVYVGSTLSEIGVPGHLSYVVCLYIFLAKLCSLPAW